MVQTDLNEPFPAHPLAFAMPFEPIAYEEYEAKALKEWGDLTVEEAFGPEPGPWRQYLQQTWTEVMDQVTEGKMTHLVFAILKDCVYSERPEALGQGILQRRRDQHAFLQAHPEVLEVDVEPPIVVVGANRSGTTLLHRLLSLDEGTRSPRGWELMTPLPCPEEETYETDPRVAKAKADNAGMSMLYPDLKYCHEMDFTQPEECLFAFGNETRLGSLIMAPGSHHGRVFDSNIFDDFYADYKTKLQILSYKYPARKHWVLKCPSHLPHLQTFLHHFPQARFVWTHRRMESVVPSYCRLSTLLSVTDHVGLTPAVMGKHCLGYYRELIYRGWDQRRALEEEDSNKSSSLFVDVDFSELVRDPLAMVERIYQEFALEWSEEFRTRLEGHLEQDAAKRKELFVQDEYAPPKPTLAEYGLDKKVIEETFADYHDQFLSKEKSGSANVHLHGKTDESFRTAIPSAPILEQQKEGNARSA